MPPSGDCEVKPERNGTVLSLSQQGLKSVPTAVFRYVGLVELDLSRNSLSAVPAEISALRALQSLRLSWNSITSLPTQLGKLTCLRRLYLEFNGLTHLPQELGNLTQLQLIQANDNKILVLPDFSKLCALCDLNLEYNLIETVPANLCLAGNGRVRVKLRGNPIANVPPDVIVDGAILPYLRKQQQSLSGVNAARPAGQANKSPECLRTKGGVSFYVEHKKSPFRASERGGDGCETCIPENEPGPSCDPRHERYTRFHDEIEELIEKTRIAVSAGTGTCGAEGSPRPSPGRQKIHRSPAPATHSGRNLFKSSVAVPSTSNAGLQELQVTPTASTAGSRATPVQEKSPRKMKPVNFVSDRVEGMSLEECFTVNGETRKASEDQKAEEQENYEPTPRLPTSRDEAAESPITTTQAVINQEIDQETVDIVQNLLAARRVPASVMRSVMLDITEPASSDDSSSDEGSPQPPALPHGGRRPEEKQEEDLPSEFLCPISHSLMTDPVVLADGFTYERSSIERWFKLGKKTSPMTGLALENTRLTSNFLIRSMIKKVLEK